MKAPATPMIQPGIRRPQRLSAEHLIGWLLAVLAAGLSCALSLNSALARDTPTEDLVGVIMAEREVATLLVLRHRGRIWLPFKEFSDLTRMKSDKQSSAGTSRTVRTPLGETTLPASSLFKQGGIAYVDSKYLVEQLNFRIEPRSEQTAIAVVTPWNRRSREDAPAVDHSGLIPDVLPPSYGVSTVHGSMSYQATGNGTNVFDNTMRMTGFAGGGVWQFAYDEDLENERKIRDAIWMRQLTPTSLVQVGHQSITLHPLLSNHEITGVQYAWSTRPIVMSGASFYPGALLTRHGRHRRSFRGRGPVGGWAELWLDGLLISRRDIRLNGTYEFDNVPLASRQARIEIRIFDHHQPDSPVEIVNNTVELSELLLDAGQATVLSGAGLRGNAFDVFGRDTNFSGGLAGFTFGRWGLSNSVTFEAAVDMTEDSQRLMGGVVAQLRPGLFTTLTLATDQSGGIGYDAELAAKRGRWQLMLNSFRALRSAPSSSLSGSGESPNQFHTAHFGYTFSQALELGLLARHDDDATFVLPYAHWSPFANTMIRVRPDRVGDYQLDAYYRYTPRDTFTLTADYENGALTYSHAFANSDLLMSFRVGYHYDDGSSDYRLALAGTRAFSTDISWRAAFVTSDDLSIGLELSLRRKIRDGVYGYLDAGSGHPNRKRTGSVFGERDDLRLRLGVSFDLAVSNGGLAKAAAGGVRPDVGSLTGVVAPTAKGADLSGIPILVDGQHRGRTGKDGSFSVPNVAKGNHIVEIEDDSLPLEHVAKKRSIVAAVAPGAVTSMTFHTEVLYGAAGQVVGASGDGVPDLPILVLDSAGKSIGDSTTNTFGYYRIDNLAPGSYRIEVRNDAGTKLASRSFSVTNDYAFGLDLKVAVKTAAR